MVKEVNATQVEPADQLTDHVYHYDSQNHIFELADKYEERQRVAEHDAASQCITKAWSGYTLQLQSSLPLR